MNLKRIFFLLTVCLMLTAIPALAETYTCEQQGFTFEYDPAYTVQWEEENGAVIYTDSVGYIPYAIVFQSEDLFAEPFDFIKEQYTPHMEQKYGDALLSYVEYELYDIGGKQLPAGLYTYDLDGYTIHLLRLYDSTGAQTVTYTAKYLQNEEQDTLAALAQAISSFRPAGVTADYAPAASTNNMRLTSHDIRSSDGVLVGHSVAPADFLVSSSVNSCIDGTSINYPMNVAVSAEHPSKDMGYIYQSAHDYVHILENSLNGQPVNVHQDGVFDETVLVPMLQYHSAEEYADLLISTMLPNTDISVASQAERSAAQEAFERQKADKLLADGQQLAQSLAGFNVDEAHFKSVERSYRFSSEGQDYLATVVTAVSSLQVTIRDNGFMGQYVFSYISWEAPATYVYIAPASEYEAGRAGFDAFMLNTSVTNQFINANTAMGNQIRESVLQSRSMFAASSYCQSSLSGTIESGENYEDGFTDYLFDQNDYTLSNGDHIKVSTSFDYVYEDGSGNVYYSNTVPSSEMQILSPNR